MRNLSKETILKLRMAGRRGGSAKVPKGFAKMDIKRVKEIARKGGSK